MNLKGIILALSLALVTLISAEANEKILPSEVSNSTQFDVAKTFTGISFKSSQVMNKSIVFSKSAKELLNLPQIELKSGTIIYPEEISVFIKKNQKPPHESPEFKPPHE